MAVDRNMRTGMIAVGAAAIGTTGVTTGATGTTIIAAASIRG